MLWDRGGHSAAPEEVGGFGQGSLRVEQTGDGKEPFFALPRVFCRSWGTGHKGVQ